MFMWEKMGVVYNPVNNKKRNTWNWEYAQGENTLEFKDFIRVYFCTREKPNQYGQTISRVSFVDIDKNNPMQIIRVSDSPLLELGSLGEFDEYGTYPFTVIKNNEEIWGYYGGVTRCESVPFNVAIGLCISKDGGYTFKRYGKGPVLSYSYDEPFVVCSPKVRKYDDMWYMVYSAGTKWTQGKNRPEICYKLRMATSDDGIHWNKLHKNIIPSVLGEDESQACGDIMFKNGKYHMFFCYRAHENFRRNSAYSYRIGYAYSYDLVEWIRDDSKAGIDISSNKDDWDSEMVAYPHLFSTNGRIYMLYLGNQVGKYGFGIAELKGDLE